MNDYLFEAINMLIAVIGTLTGYVLGCWHGRGGKRKSKCYCD